MKILITNHHLNKLGGSETFTYTLVKAAKEWGANVDLFTFHPGRISEKIKTDFGVKTQINSNYDLILANHNSTVRECYARKIGPVIQTIHGTTPVQERPNINANAYVAISEEIENHIHSTINLKRPVSVIRNGIDTDRFKDRTYIAPQIKSVLSLCHNEELNDSLREILNKKQIQFKSFNKFKNPVWNIEKEIGQHDLVISLGRGAYEAFACGRPVLVLDHRPYQHQLSDGMALPENMDKLAQFNFSGRYYRDTSNLRDLIDRELPFYSDENQIHYRQWAVENLNYKKNFTKYLQLWKEIS